jgi:Arylsulfotransferase (ASST)
LDEFFVIDHSTTTAQASSHSGGDSGMGGGILYRWGRPSNYGASGQQVFYVLHHAQWIDPGLPGAGNIMVFNNGDKRPGGSFSTLDELTPPVDGHNYSLTSGEAFGPADLTWTYQAQNKTSFYSNHISSTQRLPNGNTFACEGTSGRFIEVTAAGELIWEYTVQGGTKTEVARAARYPADYPGLAKLKK